MKRFAWRVLSFSVAFVILSLLWLLCDVPWSVCYWFQDRWKFVKELWSISDGADANG